MESTTRNLLTEGILLAGVSAYVYLVTFVYEYGYCSYFLIPRSLIDPNLSTVLVAAATIGGVFVSSLKLMGLSAPLFRAAADPNLAPYREFFGFNALFVLLGIFFATVYGLTLRGTLIFLGLVGVFELLYFAPVLLFKRDKPLRERFDAYRRQKSDQLDLPALFAEWYGVGWLRPALISLGLLFVAYFVGHGEASRKQQFLVSKASPDIVILRNYGDLFIGARFDRSKKLILDELILARLGQNQTVEYFNEPIGPLTLRRK